MGERRKSVAGGESAGDYAVVRHVLRLLAERGRAAGAGDLGGLAAELGIEVEDLQHALERWSGQPLAAFAVAWTEAHVRGRLAGAAALLAAEVDAARAHDFDLKVAANITDEARRRGDGLEIAYGFHASAFGTALLMMTPDGVCGLAFADDEVEADRQAALDDMMGRWPRARFREAPEVTGPVAGRIFGARRSGVRAEVPLVLIGTPFDLAVWQTLLRIPMGRIVSYADIARHLGRPEASRAVGTANGRNPISFVVPCHRALRGDGALGGYYWGLDRKRALLAWEIGRAGISL